ncbi:unnamed protein product [Auanema sp. JU1783]|nr:unnamed protein product [Auanema sp. JU1783]
MFKFLFILPLVFAQQPSWQGQAPPQLVRNPDGTQEWQSGNLRWNPSLQQWFPISTDQQLQVAPQPNPEVAVAAAAAPQKQALTAKQQRLQSIYGVPGKRNANQKLRTCCRNLKEADVDCRRRYCDFNALRADQVIGFMATCASRGPTVGQMWDCASSRVDHTECCSNEGVLDQCLPYCETTKGVPTDYVKYIVCLSQFDKIRTCFYNYLDKHPNIDGED